MVQVPEFLLMVYKFIKQRRVPQEAQNVSRSNLVVHHHGENDAASHEYNASAAQKIRDSITGRHATLKKSAVYNEASTGIDAMPCNNVHNEHNDPADNNEKVQDLINLEKQLSDANVECKKMLQQTVKIIGTLMKKQEATDAQIQRLIHPPN